MTVTSAGELTSSVATMIVAPVLGFIVDLMGKHGWGGQFWPIGAAGAVIALVFLIATRASR